MAAIQRQVQFDIYTKHETVLFENYDHHGFQPLTDFGIFHQKDKDAGANPRVRGVKSHSRKETGDKKTLLNLYSDYLNEYVDENHTPIPDGTENTTVHTKNETQRDKDKYDYGLDQFISLDDKETYRRKHKHQDSSRDSIAAERDVLAKVNTNRRKNDRQTKASSIPILPRIPSQRSLIRFAAPRPTGEESLVRKGSSQPTPTSKKRSSWKVVGKLTKVINFLRRPEKRVPSRITKANFEVCYHTFDDECSKVVKRAFMS